jgi:hypothetical protein
LSTMRRPGADTVRRAGAVEHAGHGAGTVRRDGAGTARRAGAIDHAGHGVDAARLMRVGQAWSGLVKRA